MAGNRFAPRAYRWEELTRTEIAQARDEGALVAIPTGAVEQHADHLPTGTDTFLAQAVAEIAAARTDAVRVLVAPAVVTGFSPHHLGWPGTISLRLDTYLAVLRDTALSILRAGFRRAIFVNGHGGNAAPLRALVGEMVTDGHPVGMVGYMDPARSDIAGALAGGLNCVGHACEYETALVMALSDAASAERIAQDIAGLPRRLTQPWMVAGGEDPITAYGASWPPIFAPGDCGYWGEPAAATAVRGKDLLEITVAALSRFYADFAVADLRTGGGWKDG